jgi:hypothetical protein
MSERPRSSRRIVHLLIAATVLGLGFGGGVLVGRATRERRHPATEKSAASISAAEAKSELAACRREAAARAKARATPPATATPPPEETDDAGLETAAKVEALQKEVDECKVSKTLQSAYLCGTFGDHITLWDVLMTGTQCMEEAGLKEYLGHSLDKCAEFDGFPAHLDKDKLTKEEESRVVESITMRAVVVRYQKNNYMVDAAREMRRRCRKAWALPDE